MFVLALFVIEHKIAKNYNFDGIFNVFAHGLTFDHLIYQAVITHNNVISAKNGPPTNPTDEASKDTRETLASVIGFTIYTSVAVCMALTVVHVRYM